MSDGKYVVLWSSYPFLGYHGGRYATNWFFLFLLKFLWAKSIYPIVDVEYRDHDRMDRIAREARD